MKRVVFTVLFCFVAIADLYQVYNDGTRIMTKPLVMIALIAYFLAQYSSITNAKPKTVFLIALIAALAGDTLLMFEGFFIHGLLAFLIMQVSYSWCFWKDRMITSQSYWYGLFLVALISTAAYFLWPGLGSLKLPVLIYMSAIAVMSYTAFSRKNKLPGYTLVFAGTLLFIISDTVLAIHKFDAGIELGKLTVMFTYIAAQYAIVMGYLAGAVTTD